MKKKNRNHGPTHELDSPVKLLFGLYQCQHHLSFLTGDAENHRRKPFEGMVQKLDHYFLPALPNWNQNYRTKCHETNERWRQEQIGNLTEHYQWCVEALKGSISAYHLTSSELISNLNQAKKWAKQHFKRKFRNKVFDKIDQIAGDLVSYTVSESGTKKPNTNTNFKPQTKTKQVLESENPKPVSQSQKPSTSGENKTQVKTKQVIKPAAPSTPSRKRGRAPTPESSPVSTPETSPVQTQTPKRSKRLSYADKAASPPSVTNNTRSDPTPAVTKFRSLKREERGLNMHSVWEIPKLTKDILVIGDSNLSRISYVNNRNAQVISYSGLNLYTLFRIVQAFKYGPGSDNPGVKPSHVIFSVGINDRGSAEDTNKINIRKVANEAKRQFPGSKISFCLVPFEQNKFTLDEKTTLNKLNDEIKSLCNNKKEEFLNCIDRISPKQFSTARNDKIHWTENCANAIIEHILNNLN